MPETATVNSAWWGADSETAEPTHAAAWAANDVPIQHEGGVLWLEREGVRYEIREFDPVRKTHLFLAESGGFVLSVDRLDLLSARARGAAVRGFAREQRPLIEQLLIRLGMHHRALMAELMDGQEPILLNGADVKVEDIGWLWRHRVARRKTTIFDGDPGLGKSVVALDLAARLSSGRDMPDGEPNPFGGQPVASVLLSAEDDPSDTIMPRFLAAGGHPRYIEMLRGVKGPDGERLPNLADVRAIRTAIERSAARLLIVDPLMAYVPAGADAHQDAVVRRLMLPITLLVAELDCGFIPIRHLTKAIKGVPAMYRGQASIGLSGAARAVFMFGKDPNDPSGQHRCIAPVKFNIGKEPPTIAYTLIAEPHQAVHVRWSSGTVAVTADDLVNPPLPGDGDGEPATAVAEAKQVLSELLMDGAMASKDVARESRAAGVSRYALLRAKAELGVIAHHTGPDKSWIWELPKK